MPSSSTTPKNAATPDPRPSLYEIISAIGTLISSTQAAELHDQTPCAEYNVAQLQDHLVFVLRRIAALGDGQHFSAIDQTALDSGWSQQWSQSVTTVEQAWQDDAKLGQDYEVPWGTFPGFAVLYSYTGELAAHGWDLARATGRKLEVSHIDLEGALMAVKMIPAEGREAPEMPFDMPVEVGPDATTLEQIAAWQGRKVAAQ